MTAAESSDSHQDTPGGRAMLARALGRARWSIFWERLWPALASIATAAGLFLAISWLGVWLWLPPIGRAIGLFVFFVLCVAATVPLFMVRVPSAADGLRRLDRASRLPHRPATTIADEMAASASDPYAVALWRAHIERALRAVRVLKAGMPVPRLAARDPFALRALVVILVVSTFLAAGGERGRRIAAAFDWQGVIAGGNYRVDAWVTPPAYTGRPPVILQGLRPGETARTAAAIAVPTGSTLIVRATGKTDLDIAVSGAVTAAVGEAHPQLPTGSEERRFTITGTGTAKVRGIDDLAWSFTAIPDRAPAIALAKEPESQGRGSLLLVYKMEDDYGVVDAQATFVRKPPAISADREPHPLYSAPDFPLVLPQARTKNGIGQTTKDLTEHP